jgi:uncharacterized protein (DUF433 family)
MTAVPLSLVELDDKGVAWISRTKTKVIEVTLDKVAYGWSPEEIHFQHDYLSLAQIHAALAYYYERHAEFDAQMSDRSKRAKALAEAGKDSPGRQRLRSKGLL